VEGGRSRIRGLKPIRRGRRAANAEGALADLASKQKLMSAMCASQTRAGFTVKSRP